MLNVYVMGFQQCRAVLKLVEWSLSVFKTFLRHFELFSVYRTSLPYHSTDCLTKLNVRMRCNDCYHKQHGMLFSTFVEEILNISQPNHSKYFNKIERMLKQMLNVVARVLIYVYSIDGAIYVRPLRAVYTSHFFCDF